MASTTGLDVMEGPLSKWTNVVQGWCYRWFVLNEVAGTLAYYTSKDKMMRAQKRGCVRLTGAVVGIDDENDSLFTITVDNKMFHLQASLGGRVNLCRYSNKNIITGLICAES